jgi:uncharacterized DUF497 family protein
MFNWNQANIEHIAKHGITPAEAEQVILNNPIDLTMQTRSEEERIVQVGETDRGRVLVVITTMRAQLIRVVTAFPAKERLRNLYRAQKERTHDGGTEETELQE